MDHKEVGESKSNKINFSDKLRTMPTWQIVIVTIVFFPLGLYLLWQQNRWSKRKKKLTTWAISSAVVACLALIVIFAPPSVTVTSSLSSVNASTYLVTGTVYPSGSSVTINGLPAKVTDNSFSSTVPLKEGDNNLRVVVKSGDKRTEKVVKVHRYTKSEVAAQEKAEAKKKAAIAAAKAKADASAAAQAKQRQEAAQAKAAADAAAKARAAVTVSQKNAVSKAKSYLSYTAFSHDGLVAQLEYEKFSTADAIYGADNSGADWNQQAAKKAKSYMSHSSFSRGGLIDQLIYEKFTPEQAAFGADSVGL